MNEDKVTFEFTREDLEIVEKALNKFLFHVLHLREPLDKPEPVRVAKVIHLANLIQQHRTKLEMTQ